MKLMRCRVGSCTHVAGNINETGWRPCTDRGASQRRPGPAVRARDARQAEQAIQPIDRVNEMHIQTVESKLICTVRATLRWGGVRSRVT